MLNRIITLGETGIRYECDPRQVELIVKQVTDAYKRFNTKRLKPWAKRGNTQFQSLAARVNYACADRPDIAYSGKEACTRMSQTLGFQMRSF